MHRKNMLKHTHRYKTHCLTLWVINLRGMLAPADVGSYSWV